MGCDFERGVKEMEFNFAKKWGPHHMAIRYQENGAMESEFARRALFRWIDERAASISNPSAPIPYWCWEYYAEKGQSDSVMEYRFARERMGITERDQEYA
jgi:hypothetical protein